MKMGYEFDESEKFLAKSLKATSQIKPEDEEMEVAESGFWSRRKTAISKQ